MVRLSESVVVGLLDVAVVVEVLLLEVDVVGVVLVGGFGGFLVALDVEEELGDGREVLRGRRGFVGADDAGCCAETDALAMQRRSARQRWPMLKDKPSGERREGEGGVAS